MSMRLAAVQIEQEGAENVEAARKAFEIKPPQLFPRVVPAGTKAPVLAEDNAVYGYLNGSEYAGWGFPGYQYLAGLATRSEYRAMASAYSTELTREWIEFTSSGEGDDERIKQIEAEFKRLDVRGVVQMAAEHDCLYGRGQIFFDIQGANAQTPLILDPRTVRKGSLKRISAVEAVWTTPVDYDALDPAAPNFYKPTSWFMMGRRVHASRLMTMITRPMPDILKPAFNFGGISLSQLAEPYVNNWLTTRQSVAELIKKFSITMLSTDMGQVLQGSDGGQNLITRARLFNATRNNQGLALLDKNTEEITQVNTPLSGLHELQSQAQEHMCAVSRTPAMILTGISPQGLNASSEGEIRAWYDWIAAQQTAYWRVVIETILQLVQLNIFGAIDSDINFDFVPLYQMTPKEIAEIRKIEADTDSIYVNDIAAISPEEVRTRLASDKNSGYSGLDPDDMPDPPEDENDNPFAAMLNGGNPNAPAGLPAPAQAQDRATWKEDDHPRAENGQFGSGGGNSAKKPEAAAPKAGESSYEQTPGLNDAERKIETDFHEAITKAPERHVDEYRKRFGNVIDPDLVKTLNADFAANNDLTSAVHEPSSRLAKMIYADALKRKADAGDTSPTVFTAGGSGSGKSTTMPKALETLGAEPGGLIYDSVLSNFKSATSRIDQALEATKGSVGIAYTNANIEQALAQNAFRKRAVSIDTLVHAHAGASDTLRELMSHYKDNPRVEFVVMNNQGAKEDAHVGSVDDVPTYNKFQLRKQLVSVAKRLLRHGHISKERYDLLVR